MVLLGRAQDVAHAAVFNVTTADCRGAGSMTEAMAAANANPGADTIAFNPGITVDVASCHVPVSANAIEYFALKATESVIVEGNGATVKGDQYWMAPDGTPKPGRCPSGPGSRDIIMKTVPGLLRIGQPGADNSGVSVTLRNMTVRGLSVGVSVREEATLNVEAVVFDEIFDLLDGCGQGVIDAHGGGNVNATDSVFQGNNSLAKPAEFLWEGAVITGIDGGQLNVLRCTFQYNPNDTGAISWGLNDRIPQPSVNIVSTQVFKSGGLNFSVSAGHSVNIVNSAINLNEYEELDNVIQITGGGTMNVIASSVWVLDPEGTARAAAAWEGVPFSANLGSTVNFVQSAIGAGIITAGARPARVLGGDAAGTAYHADDETWIQPIADQNAAELRSITHQPNLLTDPDGLPTMIFGPAELFPNGVTPMLGSGGTPGKLLDVIDSSECGTGTNQLINPIDGSCIDRDVFGHPRWDNNLKRNIGAVQLSLAPRLALQAATNGAVDLAWSRPQDPASGTITGYAVLFRPAGTADPFTRVDIAGAAVTMKQVNSLTNGTRYEFKVVAVNGVGDGPESNAVEATPLGPVHPPVPNPVAGDGEVTLTWAVPDAGGHTIVGYTVLFREQGSLAWVTDRSVAGTAETVHGLVNGVSYEFGVTTDTVDSLSSLSTPVVATPTGPTAIRLTAVPGEASVNLSWDQCAIAGAASYRIEYRVHNLATWTALPSQPLGPVTAVVNGLSNGQLYDFRIMILDGGGQVLAASNIASATPGVQTILGKRMGVRNPCNDPARRFLVLRAADQQHLGSTLLGDPTVVGAVLTVIANGNNPTSQAFTLPASGWRPVTGGYRYRDGNGLHGPVVRARITLKNGKFVVRAIVTARHGAVDVVPPNPGLDGGFILAIDGFENCVLFDENAFHANRGDEHWVSIKPTTRGCPVAMP